jgi:hypothetical protein
MTIFFNLKKYSPSREIASRSWGRMIVSLIAALISFQAFSQTNAIDGVFRSAGWANTSNFKYDAVNEDIDAYSGSLTLTHLDLIVRGNGGMDIKVLRSYGSSRIVGLDSSFFTGAGQGWSLDFGRIVSTQLNVCKASGYYVENQILELPDGSRQVLVPVAGYFLTAQMWRADCMGGGLLVRSPSGVRYEFTNHVAHSAYPPNLHGATAWYLTRMEDRNGNFINVRYVSAGRPEILYVENSEGKRVEFEYYSGGEIYSRVKSVSGGGIIFGMNMIMEVIGFLDCERWYRLMIPIIGGSMVTVLLTWLGSQFTGGILRV